MHISASAAANSDKVLIAIDDYTEIHRQQEILRSGQMMQFASLVAGNAMMATGIGGVPTVLVPPGNPGSSPSLGNPPTGGAGGAGSIRLPGFSRLESSMYDQGPALLASLRQGYPPMAPLMSDPANKTLFKEDAPGQQVSQQHAAHNLPNEKN